MELQDTSFARKTKEDNMKILVGEGQLCWGPGIGDVQRKKIEGTQDYLFLTLQFYHH